MAFVPNKRTSGDITDQYYDPAKVVVGNYSDTTGGSGRGAPATYGTPTYTPYYSDTTGGSGRGAPATYGTHTLNGIPISDHSTKADLEQLANQPSLIEAILAGDYSPNTPTQAELMADPSLMTPEMFAAQNNYGGFQNTGGGETGGGTGRGIAEDSITKLSEARAPRGLDFSNLFGTTGFDPETGQFTSQVSPEFQKFQEGLMGQLVGAQQQYTEFDPERYAQTYIDAVMQPRDIQRKQQEQTALSRMIAGGKLGGSAQARAQQQLATQQSLEDVQTKFMGQQYGAQEQQRLLGNVGGLFGLAGDVAAQQFAPQQAALAAVPLLQEIYSFPEEPQFQHDLFQKQLEAQKSANSSGLFGDMFSALVPYIF